MSMFLTLLLACGSDPEPAPELPPNDTDQPPLDQLDTDTPDPDTDTPDPDPDTDTGDTDTDTTDTGDTGTADTSDTSAAAPVLIELRFTITDFLALPVSNADMCSSNGCWPITNGFGTVEVEADADVEFWVEGADYVRTTFQFHSPAFDLQLNGLLTAHHAEALAIQGMFGVSQDPSLATVAQFVVDNQGVQPSLDGAADGPYYMDLFGTPQPLAQATQPGGGFYLFFNVDPAATTHVELPGCLEGSTYWGAPDDESIDVALDAEDALGLFTVICQ